MTSPWLRPGPAAVPGDGRLKIVCFAYAGRGASVFQEWPKLLDGAADVLAVQFPGREERLNDAPVTGLDAFLDEFLPALRPWTGGPFALFGHCLGALLAAETAIALRDREGIQPGSLILSGSAPPWTQRPLGNVGALTDGEFVRGLRQAGVLEPRHVAEPALLALMLPAIRADYELFESARAGRPRPADPPLSCPLTLFAGDLDPSAGPEAVTGWSALTSAAPDLRVFPGDHFFLDSAADDVVAAVGSGLARP
ncbi:thioesterase II family protein [Actinocorallia populi]|uniref:thioesterase II family protein n=1 Tax=Actinocorallia populi TaxID=2079200 RepID=UPI000D097E4A|nr:alpha/beta fold hydrolase [Actinocorallia populi]